MTFAEWTPAQLMAATGFRHDLVSIGSGQRVSWAIAPGGKRHRIGANAAERAHRIFSRLARMRGIDPNGAKPAAPLALINGRPQDPNRRGHALT